MKNFTEALVWPNGMGETPCSREYYEISQKINDLLSGDISMNDLSRDDYELYNRLSFERDEMLMSGEHVGKSIRYDEPMNPSMVEALAFNRT